MELPSRNSNAYEYISKFKEHFDLSFVEVKLSATPFFLPKPYGYISHFKEHFDISYVNVEPTVRQSLPLVSCEATSY